MSTKPKQESNTPPLAVGNLRQLIPSKTKYYDYFLMLNKKIRNGSAKTGQGFDSFALGFFNSCGQRLQNDRIV